MGDAGMKSLRIEISSKVMLGKAVIKGTRLPVDIVVEKMAYSATIEDLKKDYPFLKDDDIRALSVRSFAHRRNY